MYTLELMSGTISFDVLEFFAGLGLGVKGLECMARTASQRCERKSSLSTICWSEST